MSDRLTAPCPNCDHENPRWFRPNVWTAQCSWCGVRYSVPPIDAAFLVNQRPQKPPPFLSVRHAPTEAAPDPEPIDFPQGGARFFDAHLTHGISRKEAGK